MSAENSDNDKTREENMPSSKYIRTRNQKGAKAK